MATVSERLRDLVAVLDKHEDIRLTLTSISLIEQALLAERRLAFEEAAKIASVVREEEEILSNKLAHENHLTKAREAWCWSRGAITVMQAIRVAAEKEVGK